jgi:hypothetical protein
MAEIVNLKRARKARLRTDKEKLAAENRTRFGTPKALLRTARIQAGKEKHGLDLKRMDAERNKNE